MNTVQNMQFESDIWQRLNKEKPILFLYGTGNGADRVIDRLNVDKTPITGIFAGDGFVRDRYFRDFKVMSYADAHRLYPFMTVLMCFGTKRPEIMAFADKIASEHPFFAPDVPVYGDSIFDLEFYKKHQARLNEVRKMLCDGLSVKTFDDIIQFKLSGDVRFLKDCEIPKSDFYDMLNVSDAAVFLDLGAYTGDTVSEFLCHVKKYSRIIAVEPEKRNFRKLCENTENVENIKCISCAVSDTDGERLFDLARGRGTHISENGKPLATARVDSILGGQRADIIKIDVEGSELSAIESARTTIMKYRPALRVACYHRSEDIFALPLKIKELCPEYRVYMRHLPHIPAWDTEYYFI